MNPPDSSIKLGRSHSQQSTEKSGDRAKLKPFNKVRRSADIDGPVSDQFTLIKIIDLPTYIQKQWNKYCSLT